MASSKTAYETHLGPRHIRLLNLSKIKLFGGGAYFIGTQKIVDLDTHPMYRAISYTWDYPYRKEVWVDGKLTDCSEDYALEGNEELSARMLLDGLEISIRSNLCRALASFARETRTGWVWIDALCIRQDDLKERDRQVQMMRSIYSRAQEVLIYLGHEWSSSFGSLADVAEMINGFTLELAAALKEKRLDSSELNMASIVGPVLEEELGMKDLKRKIFTFNHYCRMCQWFNRVWCLQEVVLARKTILHCGPPIIGNRFSWNELSLLVRVLRHYGWYGLTEFEPNGARHLSDLTFDSTGGLEQMVLARIGVRLLFGRPSASEKDEPMSDIDTWEKLVAQEATILHGQDSENEVETWWHRHYSCNLSLVKGTVSVEEESKVFGVLLLSSGHLACKNDLDRIYGLLGLLDLFVVEDISHWIPVDYTRSVQDVYKDAMFLMLEKSQNLDLIVVQQSRDTGGRDWPFWLLDFRTAHRVCPVSFDTGRPKSNASAGLSEIQNHYPDCGPPFQIDGPKISAFGGRFDVISQVVVRDCAVLDCQRLQILGDILPTYIRGRRRFEVIWRTLTHDDPSIYEPKGPALAENEFLRCLASAFVQSVNSEPYSATRCTELAESFAKVLRGFELSSEASLKESVEYICKELECVSNDHDPDLDFTDHLRRHRFAKACATFCMSIVSRVSSSWQLFVTQQGFLGSCASNTQVGDGIWVLNGARAPFILRPSPDNSSYTFVGDTFMLDLMNGEMLNEDYGLRDRLRYIDII